MQQTFKGLRPTRRPLKYRFNENSVLKHDLALICHYCCQKPVGLSFVFFNILRNTKMEPRWDKPSITKHIEQMMRQLIWTGPSQRNCLNRRRNYENYLQKIDLRILITDIAQFFLQ